MIADLDTLSTRLTLATAAVQLGVDGLVIQGLEAGGHNRSVVLLARLLSQVRDRLQAPRAHPGPGLGGRGTTGHARGVPCTTC